MSASRLYGRVAIPVVGYGCVALLALAVAGVFILLRDASPAWMMLVFVGIGAGAMVFWFPSTVRLLVVIFAVTLPIDISKALVSEGGVYAPGLSLKISDLPLLALLAHWFFERWHERDLSALLHRHALPLSLLTWIWLGVTYSQERLAGIFIGLTYTKYFLMYAVMADIVVRHRLFRTLLTALAAGFALQLLYVVAQVVSGSGLELQGAKATQLGTQLVFDGGGGLHARRPSGFLHHPNVLADYLVFLLPCCFALMLVGKRALGGNLWLGCAAVFLSGAALLVLTLSRGGWISFAAAMLVVVALGHRRRLIRTSQIAAVIGIGLIGIAATAVIYPQAYLRIIESDSRSTESRLVMIDQATLIISRNPLLGVGTGGYNAAAQQNVPESFSYVSQYFQDQIKKGVVHTWYLLVAAEHGLLGLGLFIAVIVAHLRKILPLRRWPNRSSLALGIGLAAALVGQLTFFTFDHFYGDVRIQMLWMTMALVQALHVSAGSYVS